jgi:hypothetical protein
MLHETTFSATLLQQQTIFSAMRNCNKDSGNDVAGCFLRVIQQLATCCRHVTLSCLFAQQCGCDGFVQKKPERQDGRGTFLPKVNMLTQITEKTFTNWYTTYIRNTRKHNDLTTNMKPNSNLTQLC